MHPLINFNTPLIKSLFSGFGSGFGLQRQPAAAASGGGTPSIISIRPSLIPIRLIKFNTPLIKSLFSGFGSGFGFFGRGLPAASGGGY